MSDNAAQLIVFDNVSKFYGEILGVNRINLTIQPGITSLVGPNGAGKTTLMNLMCGLLQPTRGQVRVLGIAPNDPAKLFHKLGYCAQFDSFPRGMTGREFVRCYLSLHGFSNTQINSLTERALTRVGLTEAANRKCDSYSKGMRQRIRLAQSIAHEPDVLILDEPLNGLDPMARAEIIALFRELAKEGLHLILSSHILHEVDMMSDRVVLINNGYVVAEGGVPTVRNEMIEHPMRILIRCDNPNKLASEFFLADQIISASLTKERNGVVIETRDADRFYQMLEQLILNQVITVESVSPVDDDLSAVYQYLIGTEGEGR